MLRVFLPAVVIAALIGAGAAWAGLVQLPPGQQVNNDPASGINPALSVSGEDHADPSAETAEAIVPPRRTEEEISSSDSQMWNACICP